MKVFAFVGPSGTGKSYRASVVAHEHGIDCIIDDGILIHQNRLIAGFSAKKEESRLKAVRRAIFQDSKQVRDVQSALKKINPRKLLILGTSDRMVERITKALELPYPSAFIRIEDVATEQEIKQASDARLKEGKHIIPLPTMELKPHFRGYLIDPIRALFKKNKHVKKMRIDEKSVVRPVFSYYGKLVFSDRVIVQLMEYAGELTKGVVSVQDIVIRKSIKNNGLKLEFSLVIIYGEDTKAIISRMQRVARNEIENITGMSVEMMKISVKNVVAVNSKE